MPQQTPTPAAGARSTAPTSDLALIAFFAALVAVCAILPGIHVGGMAVPITLQTFAVLLCGAVLGARRGFLAVLLYLVVGFAGLPIFADMTGGLGTFAKPSIGYLLAFPLGAALTGLIVERLPRGKPSVSTPLIFLAGLAGSIVFIHTLGVLGMAWRIPTSIGDAFVIDLTFWPGDVVKNIVMAIVATAVHRAFPDLLPGRR
ncbi:MAG: biotin transporter BioY [Nocardioidaceae bacterium]